MHPDTRLAIDVERIAMLRVPLSLAVYRLEASREPMQLTSEVLKSLRKVFHDDNNDPVLRVDLSGQEASDRLRDLLQDDQACMISRFGSNELDATLRAFERQRHAGFLNRSIRYVKGEIAAFWWDRSIRKRMSVVAGFFPPTNRRLTQFGERMLDDIRQIDVLGSWRKDEFRLRHLFPSAQLINLIDLEPFRHSQPWTTALQDRKVLVVHPFAESIEYQYRRRDKVHRNPQVLPSFELQTLRTIVSNAKNPVDFETWFDALEFMCHEISQRDFEIAIIGAGAYGLPLAAYVKRLGKKAFHMGGATQLLFGIKGSRWDAAYQDFYTTSWIRPQDSEKPKRSDLVEQSAYW